MKILFLGAMLFLTAVVSAAPTIPVRECGSILDVPDGRYRLVRNLECTGPAVVITADNVQFNLGRRTISGPGGSTSGPAIRVAGTAGAQISNGEVNEYAIGVFLFSTSEADVRDLSIDDCGSGIVVYGSTTALVENNTINGASSSGISILPNEEVTSDNNKISKNIILNSREGIRSVSSNGSEIRENVISDSSEIGIYLIEAVNHTVQGNVIVRSTFVGMQLQETSGAQILNNISNDSGYYGIAMGNNLGEAPNNNNTIQGNTTNRNGDLGIFIVIGTGNVLTGNTSFDNVNVDMWDNFTCMNTWTGNTFVTDSEGDGPGAGCIQ